MKIFLIICFILLVLYMRVMYKSGKVIGAAAASTSEVNKIKIEQLNKENQNK